MIHTNEDNRLHQRYKPFATTSLLIHIISRMACNRLESILDVQQSRDQSRVRSNKSTVDHLFTSSIVQATAEEWQQPLWIAAVNFKKVFDSKEAHEEPLPGEWNTKLNSLQKMIVLKAIRPDKVTFAMQNYITEQIGKQYIEPPVFRLNECFKDSSNVTPLVFVLSPGSDPVASFMKLC